MITMLTFFKKLCNLIFPFLTHTTVTQVFVWRHGLNLQLKLAKTVRHNITGHYYEFGVFQLRSIINFNTVRNLYSLGNHEVKDIRIFAFDSFEGLPPSSAGDTIDPDWSAGAYQGTLDKVSTIAKKNKIKNIEFIKGYYQDSLNDDLLERLKLFPPSLIHIDCDLYSSTIIVLRWLDKISLPGALYFFDDLWKYHGHPDAGELKAIIEYNNDAAQRELLIEDPLSLGSKMVYRFCPRNPEESTKNFYS